MIRDHREDPEGSDKPDTERPLPTIIQGGMGVGVSGWQLARAVSQAGQLGVVSGVALDVVLARRLQRGDPDGLVRQALVQFPVAQVAERILARYFVPGGLAPGKAFRPIPRLGLRNSLAQQELIVAGNFVEVFLAKRGHQGLVGVNYLEKIQLATPAAAYGAMLAGADYVIMGAGVPREIPELLDLLSRGELGELTVNVAGAQAEEQHTVRFDPAGFWAGQQSAPPMLARPRFLAIVSSAVLAAYLARDVRTRPDGFVLEGPIAGGHSAPPRGRLTLNDEGEPVYGPRDDLDVRAVAAIGLPFWLAGGHASSDALSAALACGASGIQVGTAFALCRESGLASDLRRALLTRAAAGELVVRNEPHASPTGFPFKIAQLSGTLAEDEVYADRPRLCDLGYLRTPYRRADAAVGFRCPAEPVAAYVRKGGDPQDTIGRRCLCNGLTAAVGVAQRRPDGQLEPPLLTLGQNLDFLAQLLAAHGEDFGAKQVVASLLGVPQPKAGSASELPVAAGSRKE